jgi:5-methylcytosine-specific restriction protein A
MIETRTDLLQAIRKLPAKADFPQRSYKANWIRWLSKYQAKGGDRVNPHRGAEFIYNAINLPGWIVWLAAASGISPQLVHKAANAVAPKESRMTQAAAVRRVLPWSVVAKQLENARGAPNSDEQARNPPWTRDELILALELYMRNPVSPPSKSSVEVQELSATLNKLGVALGFAENNKFRNANGVYMKMMNFRRFDPEYTATGKVGLTRGNRDEKEVWREFSQDKARLVNVAHAIRQAITLPSEGTLDFDDEGITEAEEGRLLTRLHRRRERSRKLVEQRKLKALEELGRLRCEACSFDFEERYGSRGKGFIEAHHTKPVETLVEGSKTKLEDLALLCANCHRMVHATRPWLTVNELQRLLGKSSAVPANK